MEAVKVPVLILRVVIAALAIMAMILSTTLNASVNIQYNYVRINITF